MSQTRRSPAARRRSRLAGLVGTLVAALSVAAVVGAPAGAQVEPDDGWFVDGRAELTASWCRPDTTPAELGRLFDGDPAGIVGADYPRTLELPDGRILWTMQDARFRLGDGSITVVHNIGIVQEDNCFTLLTTGGSTPRPWLLADQTITARRWFWPLDSHLGADGKAYVFLAEMVEEGEDYLERAVPQGVYVARIDPDTLQVEWYGRPADASARLYGWSIQSDHEWTYLFAQCHRQFGFDPIIFDVLGHDKSCAGDVTVARVPLGELFASPRYWTGSSWSSDPSRAVSLIESSTERFANPTQFLFVNHRWIAITKTNDWWGEEIVVERAERVTGPYVRVATIRPATKCGLACNTYFAGWIDGQTAPDGRLVSGLSHNRWDGEPSSLYRPTFFTVAAPPDVPVRADRCSVVVCD